jgi:cell wall-associated NlpC family hydrolase
MMSRADVVNTARSWLRTPYHHKARIKGAGVDCGQILIAVFSEASLIEDFDPGEYPQDWMLHRSEEKYLQTVERYAQKKSFTPMPGDIALFQFGRCISHGAIVTEWPHVIHAYKPAGMVVEENIESNPDLLNRFSGLWTVFEE